MQIFVDADACPVVRIVEEVAEMALGKGAYAIYQWGKYPFNLCVWGATSACFDANEADRA